MTVWSKRFKLCVDHGCESLLAITDISDPLYEEFNAYPSSSDTTASMTLQRSAVGFILDAVLLQMRTVSASCYCDSSEVVSVALFRHNASTYDLSSVCSSFVN